MPFSPFVIRHLPSFIDDHVFDKTESMEDGRHSMRFSKLRSFHAGAAQQLLESRVATQLVQPRIDSQVSHHLVTLTISVLQPLESSVLPAQRYMNQRDWISGH